MDYIPDEYQVTLGTLIKQLQDIEDVRGSDKLVFCLGFEGLYPPTPAFCTVSRHTDRLGNNHDNSDIVIL